MRTLVELKKGQSARIMEIRDNTLKLKLMEMGCIPGALVKLSQIAPLGDPIAIEVQGYQLSLRLSEAAAIVIEPIQVEVLADKS